MPDPTPTYGALETPSTPLIDPPLVAAAGFLAGYSGTTKVGYTIDLRGWWRWCELHDLDVWDAKRTHIELYARSLEDHGYARSTIGRRISTVCCYYKWCVEEELLLRNPAAHVRRPKIDQESTTVGLDRQELGAFLVEAGLYSARDHALACLLALNGLRVSEACSTNIEDLALERGHRTLTFVRKGGKTAKIPLAPRTSRALDLAIGERSEGPILLSNAGARVAYVRTAAGAERYGLPIGSPIPTTDTGRRLNRRAAYRIVRRLGKKAGIPHKIHPHCLRHAAITGTLDAGVPLRDVQEFAGHADPRTTMRYDRHRQSLDRHAAYTLAAFVAGACNAR